VGIVVLPLHNAMEELMSIEFILTILLSLSVNRELLEVERSDKGVAVFSLIVKSILEELESANVRPFVSLIEIFEMLFCFSDML